MTDTTISTTINPTIKSPAAELTIADDTAAPVRGMSPPEAVGRRALLQRFGPLAAGVAGAVALAACDVADAPFDRRHHVARRLTYGANRSTIERIEAIGEAAWLDEQLDPSTLDTSDLDARLAQLPALEMTAIELATNFPGGQTTAAGAQLKLASMIRAVHSPAQLFERMVEFWSDHFNVPALGGNQQILKVVEDRVAIRPNALGRFSDLLVASAQSPAMLVYLDNIESSVNGINENYARELLELHSLGVNGGYTEADVVATARLLTGWGVDPSNGLFIFRQQRHDSSALTIRGWQRPTEGSDLEHGVAFLRHLAEQPETAQFVCTKLARRFVSDSPDPALVDAMVTSWLANDTEIIPVIRTMVAHAAFDAAAGGKFQRPWDFFMNAVRVVDGDVTPVTNISQLANLYAILLGLGQPPFEWPAPNGYPDVEGPWLNSGSLFNRWNLVGDIVSDVIPTISPGLSALRSRLDGLGQRAIYDEVAQTLLAQDTTAGGRFVLDTATGWSSTTTPSPSDIDEALPSIVITLLASADAQYR